MSRPTLLNKSWFCAVFILLAGLPNPLCACGWPDFPEPPLFKDDKGLLAMPSGYFANEMTRLLPAGQSPWKAVRSSMDQYGGPAESDSELSARIDKADLRLALKSAGEPEALIQQIAERYSQSRDILTRHSEAVADWREKGLKEDAPLMLDIISVPDHLPAEFSDYLRGAIAFHRGDIPGAQAAWKHLLSLDADQRSLRSTWAAFMLGKSYMKEDPGLACQWFKATRDLAAAGFADSLGLASSSLGWEAKIQMKGQNFLAAMDLYFQQYASGDPQAAMSLRDCAAAVFAAKPKFLRIAAGDQLSRSVVTAYICCNAGPYKDLNEAEQKRIPVWLDAVEAAGVEQLRGADRLAWAAYMGGDFGAAARWIAHADPKGAIVQWVRAKLLMRDGKIDQAAAVLAKIVQSFPPDSQWFHDEELINKLNDDANIGHLIDGASAPELYIGVVGDLADLQLARRQYLDCLDLLIRADFWSDAAYVAERVLSADELKAYVDRRFPKTLTVAGHSEFVDGYAARSPDNPVSDGQQLRYLLARRLARMGRWKEARDYYPTEMQKIFDDYLAALRLGHDANRPPDQRAAALMTAARIARNEGMELLGTELYPDNHGDGGNWGSGVDTPRGSGMKIAPPSVDEIARFKANSPEDGRRYHYRYIAADLAWSAAQLMPDNSDQTAAVLCEAGSWIKDRSPRPADRFYKALIQRCPKTTLARQALAIHWFPRPKDSPN